MKKFLQFLDKIDWKLIIVLLLIGMVMSQNFYLYDRIQENKAAIEMIAVPDENEE